jgi:protein O-GlcNAc transferase
LSDKTNKPHQTGRADADALLASAREWIDKGQLDEASRILLAALEANPGHADILRNLARVQLHRHEYLPALRTFDRLIGSGQADAADYTDTGDALTDVGEYAQAVDTYRRSLNLMPDDPRNHHNLARVLYRLGQTDSAARHLKQCGRLCDQIDPWLSLATILPGCSHATQQDILSARRQFADRLTQIEPASKAIRSKRPKASAKSKLRVAYLSAFFHCANYMKPVWGLINSHNRDAFEIHLFSDSPRDSDWPGYFRHPDDQVHEVDALDNAALGMLIESRGIDILVDLNAYSEPRRLGLFLGHPAPVTLAWFNMYATSGLPGIDYLVGDPWVIRPEEAGFFSETLLTLPVSYLTFAVYHDAPEVATPPCTHTGELTFGSLVTQYKITPAVLDAWAEILRRTHNTRLFLANRTLKSKWNRHYLLEEFQRRGTDIGRITLDGPRDHYAYLQYYDQIDIALDAFPYNGGTTTMEALWQGVPVLSHDGDRWASRTTFSLLAQSPVRDFVAVNCLEMVERAVAMAEDPATPDRLGKLRRHLRKRLADSLLCDTGALCRHMEALYFKVCSKQ